MKIFQKNKIGQTFKIVTIIYGHLIVESIVTQKTAVFLVHVLSSPNSTDFLRFIMRLILSSSVLTYSFAKLCF